MAEVAQRLSTATGKPVKYINIAPEEARSVNLANGMPPYRADALFELFSERRKGRSRKYPLSCRPSSGGSLPGSMSSPPEMQRSSGVNNQHQQSKARMVEDRAVVSATLAAADHKWRTNQENTYFRAGLPRQGSMLGALWVHWLGLL